MWYSVHTNIYAQGFLVYSDSVPDLNLIQFLINIHLSNSTFAQQFEITSTGYGFFNA